MQLTWQVYTHQHLGVRERFSCAAGNSRETRRRRQPFNPLGTSTYHGVALSICSAWIRTQLDGIWGFSQSCNTKDEHRCALWALLCAAAGDITFLTSRCGVKTWNDEKLKVSRSREESCAPFRSRELPGKWNWFSALSAKITMRESHKWEMMFSQFIVYIYARLKCVF